MLTCDQSRPFSFISNCAAVATSVSHILRAYTHHLGYHRSWTNDLPALMAEFFTITMTPNLLISCQPQDLDQGLFGNVFYCVLQILPCLESLGIYPAWEIRSLHYGEPPNYLTIPGSLDLAYTPPPGPLQTLTLNELRRRHAHILGNNWPELHRIWNAYFRIPNRVLTAAEKSLPAGRLLGIHYRGTDKQTATWDSNPITQEQYLTLIRDFLSHRQEFDAIFVATDEFPFVEKLRASVSLPVITLGEVDFHMASDETVSRAEKTDRAMLDCVLLSRCKAVLQTSSALPSFAKLFNPSLEIYRCAASKLFSDMPYFPVAHIPALPPGTPASAEILRLTMEGDWTRDPRMQRFQQPFTARPRWPRNHKLFHTASRIGADNLLARIFSGYR